MRSWEQFTDREDIEYILVENGFPYFEKELQDTGIQYLSLNEKLSYLRAQCLNRGAEIATGDYLILHDNDIPLPSHFFEAMDQMIAQGSSYFANYRQLRHLSQPVTRSVFEDPTRAEYGYYFMDTTPERIRSYGVDGMAGASMTIKRELFKASGGFHEDMQGWGIEDREFDCRVRFLTGKSVHNLDLDLVHLYHPRTTPADNPAWKHNCELFKRTMRDPQAVISQLCAQKEN